MLRNIMNWGNGYICEYHVIQMIILYYAVTLKLDMTTYSIILINILQ